MKKEILFTTSKEDIYDCLLKLGIDEEDTQKLLDVFNLEVLYLLENDPEKLFSVVKRKTILSARLEYAKQYFANEYFLSLSTSFTDNEIMEIYKNASLMNLSLNEVIKNPFLIYDEKISFTNLITFANTNCTLKDNDPYKIKAALLAVLYSHKNACYVNDLIKDKTASKLLNLYSESIYIKTKDLYAIASTLLDGKQRVKDFSAALNRLGFERKVFISFICGDYAASLTKFAKAEKVIADKINTILERDIKNRDNIFAYIQKAEAELGVVLSYEQENAVKMALSSPISLITGGAGTGKTSIQKVISEAYEHMEDNPCITLLAPTGQAAKRMMADTGRPAYTIHSKLGINPSTYTSDKEVVLNGLIIVDEASMIDLTLFKVLISHLDINSQLVLIGDVNQLPPVNLGEIFDELTRCKKIPHVHLYKVYRQVEDSPILYNSARISLGKSDFIYDNNFKFIDNLDTLEETFYNVYRDCVLEDGLENVICLTAYREHGKLSVNSLNKGLQKLLLDTHNLKSIKINNNLFYEGDKVCFLKNAYGLTNGDTGYIKEILNDKKIVCEFNNIFYTIENKALNYIDLAYAQTVHKSQGSQYKTVIFICDKKQKNMLSKKLIYTGVTRAKTKIIILGSKDTFSAAVAKKEEKEKLSNLRYWIN